MMKIRKKSAPAETISYSPALSVSAELAAANQFRPLALPSMFWRPNYLKPELPAWIGHIPFAFWIIEALTPSTFVELGTHYGNSYFAFCQAVDRLGLSTACFAVDTWKGDEHAGFYGDEVFAAVNTFNTNNYSGISTLVRSTFDESLPHFEDGTIDLLHIDGHHTFEAVRHDFESWLPKLSKRAVVLFHDTNVRFGSFGVNKYFAKLKAEYPWFEFNHSHGLGVLGVGSEQPENVKHLFHTADSASATGALHQIFARLGQACVDLGEAQIVRKRVLDLEAQIGAKNQEIAECLANTNQERGNLSECIAQLEVGRANLENQLSILRTEREVPLSSLKKRLLEEEQNNEKLKLELKAAAEEKDLVLNNQAELTSQLEGRIAGLEGTVNERDGRIAGLEGAVSERDGRIVGLEGVLNELQSERSNLSSDNSSLATSNSLLATEREELSARLSTLSSEHSSLVTSHSLLVAERDDLATEREALASDLSQRFEELALLGKRLLEVEAEGDRRVAAIQARMDAMAARFTWKLGAPFRFAWDKTRNTALKIYRLPTALRILRLHRSSGLFNHEWYYRQNPDVKATTARPFLHFAFHGVFEGRTPNPSYNESAYLRHTQSAQSSGMKPLLHYVLKGYLGKS